MRIANNIAALNATNLKTKNTNLISKSIEKLSSGMRINKAADDAAGLAISQKMRAQIRGLSQASRNAQDGISLIQTAEGALGEMTSIAQRMRELCVQAANGTLTYDDREKIQNELDGMKKELGLISDKTEFNTMKLLDGSKGLSKETIQYNYSYNQPILSVGQILTLPIAFDSQSLSMNIEKKQNSAINITVFNGVEKIGEKIIDPIINSNQIEWSINIGSTTVDKAIDSIKTIDGGYLVAGWTNGNDLDFNSNHGIVDTWLVKMDSNGLVEWKKQCGGSGADFLESVIQTNDGGYAMLVSSGSNDIDFTANSGNSDLWLLKLNSDGSTAFKKKYAGSEMDGISSTLVQQSNGDFVIFTSSDSSDGDFAQPLHDKSEWMIKTSSNGDVLWKKNYADYGDGTRKVAYNFDGSFFVTTWTNSASDFYNVPGENFLDAGVIKLDANGNVLWKNSVGGTGSDEFKDIIATPDGGCLAVGRSESHDGDFPYKPLKAGYGIVVKYDSSGSIEWKKAYDNYEFNSIQITDSGYILAGVTDNENQDAQKSYGLRDVWLVQLDKAGNLIKERTLGGSSQEIFPNIHLNSDGSVVLIAHSGSNDFDVQGNNGNFDFWVAKVKDFVSREDSEKIQKIDINNSVSRSSVYEIDDFQIVFSSSELKFIKGINFNACKITGNSESSINLQIGANAGQTMTINIDDMRPEALGFINDMPKVNPIEMAGVSLTLTEQALKKISSQRSTLGSYQNRLEHAMKNLDNSAENLQVAESGISDLDMAKGIAEMTKYNILSQATDAMIAQANQMPQGILQLLK